MSKNAIFYLNESASNPGKFLIRVAYEKFFIKNTNGSFNVLPARVLGVSYPNYLRLCRDDFDAEVVGKNSMYPIPFFKKNDKVKVLLDHLNARADMIIWNKEHPDFAEHEKVVEQQNPMFYQEVREKNYG